jgi:hypothetical protein
LGIRFRKSIKLLPGVRVNISRSGVSTTIGPRGASINISERGVYSNLGIPGTGISFREKLIGGSSGGRNSAKGSVDDPDVYEILNIHLKTPAPDILLRSEDMKLSPPVKVGLRRRDYLYSFISFVMAGPLIISAIKGLNEGQAIKGYIIPILLFFIPFGATLFNYGKNMKKYKAAVAEYGDQLRFQENERQKFNAMMSNSSANADEILAYVMRTIEWPRETLVTYEIENRLAVFDVDLPEIEDMPENDSSTKIRLAYARHIHGIGFRIIGETFRALSFIDTIVVSGYSQRPDKATGYTKDEYLYSVRVKRENWQKINFDNLKNIDPVEALGAFEMRRDMSKTGIFKAIEPI